MNGKLRVMGLTVLLALAVVLVLPNGLYAGGGGELQWATDWAATLKMAAEKKLPVLMDFYTDWCPPCKKLAAETFQDAGMINYFKAEKYVLIKVNPEKDRVAERKFKVYSYPTMIIIKPDGSELDRILGFRTAAQMVEELGNLKKGIGTLDDLRGKYGKFNTEDRAEVKFDLMSRMMSKYIARADYPKALELVDEIVRLDKDNGLKKAAAALGQRGYIYYKWKKFKKAIEACLAVDRVYPGTAEGIDGYDLAAYYAEKMKDTETLTKIMKEFLQKYPNHKYADRFRKKLKKLETK